MWKNAGALALANFLPSSTFRPHARTAHIATQFSSFLFVFLKMVDHSSGRPEGATGKNLDAFASGTNGSEATQSSGSGTFKETPGPGSSSPRPRAEEEEESEDDRTPGGQPRLFPPPDKGKERAGAPKPRIQPNQPAAASEEEIEKASMSIKDVLGILGISKGEFLAFRAEAERQRRLSRQPPGPQISPDLQRALDGVDDLPGPPGHVDPNAVAAGIASAPVGRSGTRRGGGSRQASPIEIEDSEDGGIGPEEGFVDYQLAYNNVFPDRLVTDNAAGGNTKTAGGAIDREGQKEKEKEKSALGSAPVTDAVNGVDMYGPEADLLSVDARLIGMGRSGFHIPLSACTSANLTSINNGSRAKALKQATRDGQTAHILDLNIFGDEQSLDLLDWREAWGNLLRFLPEICGTREVLRFHDHFDFLCRLDWFRDEFSAVLDFDIHTRRTWFLAPADRKPFFTVGSSSYVAKLNEFRLKNLNARLAIHARSSSAARYHPYANAGRGAAPPPGSQANAGARGPQQRGAPQSFQEGRSGDAAGGICLICAESGHRARDCGRTTMRNGRPAYATFAGGKLVASYGRRAICAAWNVGGAFPCKSSRCPKTPGCHACSFCGAADHNATSNRCL